MPELERRLLALLLLGASAGFACRAPGPPPVAAAPTRARHAAIVRAMGTAERRALVARFLVRNPPETGRPDERWTIHEEALTMSVMVVDPFKGFLRRAARHPAPAPSAANGSPLSTEELAGAARAFVQHNADLLGFGGTIAKTLEEEVLTPSPAEPTVVRFRAAFPSKGFESFAVLDNTVDLDVTVDRDRRVVGFVNRSTIHPRLDLDLRPDLASDDPRVWAKLLGRRVFALLDDEATGPDGARDVRRLARIELGPITASDIGKAALVIHVAAGPRLAWLTYRLAYLVEVAKPAAPQFPPMPAFYFFRYVVDADTGDVLEDASAPIVTPFRSTL